MSTETLVLDFKVRQVTREADSTCYVIWDAKKHKERILGRIQNDFYLKKQEFRKLLKPNGKMDSRVEGKKPCFTYIDVKLC